VKGTGATGASTTGGAATTGGAVAVGVAVGVVVGVGVGVRVGAADRVGVGVGAVAVSDGVGATPVGDASTSDCSCTCLGAITPPTMSATNAAPTTAPAMAREGNRAHDDRPVTAANPAVPSPTKPAPIKKPATPEVAKKKSRHSPVEMRPITVLAGRPPRGDGGGDAGNGGSDNADTSLWAAWTA
jgi:hypothetical protein